MKEIIEKLQAEKNYFKNQVQKLQSENIYFKTQVERLQIEKKQLTISNNNLSKEVNFLKEDLKRKAYQ